MKRVAIIGAGASGIAAAKSCKEENIDFDIFERSGKIGGVWNYSDEEVDGIASVMKSTVINSSKEMSAFSDFPPPDQFPNFMHNKKMCTYLIMYAEKFGIMNRIKYHHEVTKVEQTLDFEKTGRWLVTTQNVLNRATQTETYDGVLICTGHHAYPHIPTFPHQELYSGRIIHTHSIRVPDQFKDQRVLIIGVGNSGLDAAVEISSVAKQVYLSTRRGAWIMFRLGSKGLPMDTQMVTRIMGLGTTLFGWSIANTFMERTLDSKFNHELYNLRPKHRFNAQHLAINDHIPNKILSGTVIVKSDVKTLTEKGVLFKGDEDVTKVDVIILATGYEIKFPFLSDEILPTTNNKVDLYKMMFPPNLKHPTLAVIGLVQPFGALFPIFEIQSRWYAQLLNGKTKFADQSTMRSDIKNRFREMSKRYVLTPRHTVQADYIPYMDDIASQFGAKPNFLKMAFFDPLLFFHCYFGPCTAYQYRLEGPHAWPGARQAILTAKSRILFPLNTRQGHLGGLIEKYLIIYLVSLVILGVLVIFMFK